MSWAVVGFCLGSWMCEVLEWELVYSFTFSLDLKHFKIYSVPEP